MFSFRIRARFSPQRKISFVMCWRRAAISRQLLFQSRWRSALAAMALFQAREACPQHRMFFADPLRIDLRRFQLLARTASSERSRSVRACILRFRHLQVLRPLLVRAFLFALQPLQFQPRHRHPRTGPVDLFTSPAHLVFQRDRVFFPRLLQLPQLLQLLLQRDC